MNLQFRKSNRKQAKIKLGIAGPSGSGKTYSSLLLASGMTKDWDQIAVIDTENGSSDLYAHLGEYNVITLTPPYSPEHYIKAIELAESKGIKVLIIDSLSHCWEYLLEQHSAMVGNSFTNWSKITPRQNALIQKILSTDMHIISTLRTKQDYVLNQKNGKYVPEKVGLKVVQRDGVDYEFTIVFDIDIKHHVTASKDRTGLFADQPSFVIDKSKGEQIQTWCESGAKTSSFKEQITASKTMKELMLLYNDNPSKQSEFKTQFTRRRRELERTNSAVNNTPVESFEDERGLNHV